VFPVFDTRDPNTAKLAADPRDGGVCANTGSVPQQSALITAKALKDPDRIGRSL
jgi:hypothetical protein